MAFNQWVILLALAAVTVGSLVYAALKWCKAKQIEAEQTFGTFMQILPALAEHQSFYKLLELRGSKSHYLDRHGPMLNQSDIFSRASTGKMKVSGVDGNPVTSTRWLSHESLLHAVESALEHWANGERPQKGVFKFRFNDTIGEGYSKETFVRFKTNLATVIVRNGIVITAYPTEACPPANHRLQTELAESQAS